MSTSICKWYPVCPMKYYYEHGKIDSFWVENYCKNNYSQCVRYQMEENGQFHPDNMMPDGTLNNVLEG
ncbi:MAG: uracil-DNA glycosylase [Prolixibacteraceae bacterium]|nr:uracil-DNA glycosylase [Prolixibacteraceae bacterium]